MDPLVAALVRHFGHPGFRPGQEALVRAVLEGRDAVGILPTGGGKSVTYLLPAALRPGLTLVVSPLVSLMADQVERANRAGIPAGALHHGVPFAERRRLVERARQGGLKVLLLAPERLEAGLDTLVTHLPVRRLAVDEAHCIVQWGFDFRPSYLALAGLGRRLGVPVLAVTATATPAARRQLERTLQLRDPERVLGSFDRPNLRWAAVRVRDGRERWRRVAGPVRTRPGPALVYAGTRRQVEAIRHGLARRGVDAEAYHAGLAPRERARVQERFLGGSCRVVVATNAFGMGVDKADVRRVVHWSPPGSLEAYYQEAGRAGRDGDPSECVVLWAAGDRDLHIRFLDEAHPPARSLARAARRLARRASAPGPRRADDDGPSGVAPASAAPAGSDPEALRRALTRYGLMGDGSPRPGWRRLARRRRREAARRLGAVTAWLRGKGCRRRALLAYFGEALEPGRCGGCDACGTGR